MCLALQPVLEYWPANVQIGDLVRRRHRKKAMTWGLEADQSSTAEDLDGFLYTFHRGPLSRRRSIAVRIIRCEPHRHVLARSNTLFTCFMTGEAAYCSFANSLLCQKKVFVLDGEKWQDEWQDIREYILPGVHGPHIFDVVRGPPDAYVRYACAETGPRALGDGDSWVIHRQMRDPMVLHLPERGRTFEVVDFSMVHDEEGSYMRVGKPFIWSVFALVENGISVFSSAQSSASVFLSVMASSLPYSELPSSADPSAWRENSHLCCGREHFRYCAVSISELQQQVRGLDVVLLPVTGSRSEAWNLSVYTIKEGDVMWDMLDVREFFPGGYNTVLLARDPGTNEPLPNQYRLYLDNIQTARPLNRAVQDTLGGLWIGNVVVTKYNRSSVINRRSFAHITRGEADLLVHIVGKYLKGIWEAMLLKGKALSASQQ
ncbi:hypothetical protein NMY22_g898 [Coprinellus aureogranulatus]|nr:hypothetical protein NMY22_g898 [Coprinellus aureogranulatus]